VGNFISRVRKQGNGEGPEEFEIEHGVAIVATGASESKPTEYLYGKNSRVKTLLELSELISAADFKVPDNVVMIQCVGSREPDHPYCSRVCCQGAIKNAIRMKCAKPAANIFILYRDIRTYGFREKYYSEARELGITFVRYDLDSKPEVTEEKGEIKVRVYDPVLEAELEIPADLLVLSSRIDANKDNVTLSQFFKVPLNSDNFFLEAHVKLKPVEFATDGVYLSGLAHYPKDMEETISQAMAAVARALTVLSLENLEAAGKISYVNEAR